MSCRRLRFQPPFLLLLCILDSTASHASYVWSKRSQVSFAPYGAIADEVRPGRADSVLIYAPFRHRGFQPDNQGPDFNGGATGHLVALRPGSDWASGWSARELFTQLDHRSSDHHPVVDRFDNFHVVHEAFGHDSDTPPASLGVALEREQSPDHGVRGVGGRGLGV
jgi:hypothetical protein